MESNLRCSQWSFYRLHFQIYMILKAREMDLLEEGREEERIQAIRKIRQHLKCSTVEAMDILGIPADLREKYADIV